MLFHSWFDILLQIESEGDDPRSFQETGPPIDGPTAPGGGPGVDNFFSTFPTPSLVIDYTM